MGNLLINIEYMPKGGNMSKNGYENDECFRKVALVTKKCTMAVQNIAENS